MVVEVGGCGGRCRLKMRRKHWHAQRREEAGRVERLFQTVDERIVVMAEARHSVVV